MDYDSNPAVLEGKLMGLGLDQDGEVRVQNSGGGFYMEGYLRQSISITIKFIGYLQRI
jgi:hypothetical protein